MLPFHMTMFKKSFLPTLLILCQLHLVGCTGPKAETKEPPNEVSLETSAEPTSNTKSSQTDNLSADPSAKQILELGREHLSQGEYDLAIDEFSKVMRYQPPRDKSQLSQAAAPEVVGRDDEKADLGLLQIEAQYYRGLAFLEKGFPDTAVEDLKEVVYLQPKNPMAFAQRGRAHAGLNEWYSTFKNCTQAIRLQPSNAMAYRYRGLAYLRTGKFGRAVADLTEAVRLDQSLAGEANPQIAEAYYSWSIALAESGKAEEAERKRDLANRILSRSVDESETLDAISPVRQNEYVAAKPVVTLTWEKHYQQGLEYLEKEQFVLATQEFTQVIAIDPLYGEAYVKCGFAFLKRGFPDTAKAFFSEALSRGSRTSELYCLMAQAYYELGLYSLVTRYATNAIILDPNNAEAYRIRGLSYIRGDRVDRARVDLNEAIRLKPDWSDELKSRMERTSEESPMSS